jgi:cytochrome P450
MTTLERVPANLVVDFDVYSLALAVPVDIMQERMAELRAAGPVVYSAGHGGHWIVTRYKKIQQVLTDPETFLSYPNNLVTRDTESSFLSNSTRPTTVRTGRRCSHCSVRSGCSV